MELKGFLLGLVFSMGTFASKNGLGLRYIFYTNSIRLRKKYLFILGYCIVYAGIFLFLMWILQDIDFLKYIEVVQQYLRSDMLLYGILVVLHVMWGVYLLREDLDKENKNWELALIILPCPVCLLVIMLNISFLFSLFPQRGLEIAFGAWTGFVGFSLLSTWLLGLFVSRIQSPPELAVGSAMLCVSLFFLLSLLLIPQIDKLEEVYKLISYQDKNIPVKSEQVAILVTLVLTAFTTGFLRTRKKIKGFHLWLSEHS